MPTLFIRSVASAGILAAATIAGPGCMQTPREPIPPSWDADLTLPVATRTYSFADLVDGQGATQTTEPVTGRLVLQTTARAPESAVGDMIRIDPMSTSATLRLGPFRLDDVSTSIGVDVPGLPPGSSVPPFSNVDPGLQAWSNPQFVRISLQSGTLRLSLANNLPVPVTVTSNPTLYDSAGTMIVSFPMAGQVAQPSGVISADADLAGTTMTGEMSIGGIRLSSPGGAGTVPAGDDLTFGINAWNLTGTSAVLAEIPAQRIVDNDSAVVPLSDSTRIREMRVSTGTLRFQVQSGLGVNSRFGIRFLEVFDRFGAPLTDSVDLPAGVLRERVINLAGMWLRSRDGALMSSLTIFSTVDLHEGSAGARTYLSENDGVTATVSLSSVQVDTLVGVVKPTLVQVSQTMALDLGDLNRRLEGRIVIPEADLVYRPSATFGFPVELNLVCEARNPATGVLSVLPVPSTKTGMGLEEVRFARTDVGQFLTSLAGALPESIRVAGSVLLNPDYDTTRLAAIGARTGFGGEIDFGLPLTIAIVGGLLRDTTEVGDTSGTGERIDSGTLDNMNSGTLHVSVDNGLPVGAGLTVMLLDGSNNPVLILPQSAGDTIRVTPGEETTGPAHSNVAISLSSEEMRRFNTASSMVTSLAFGTPGGNFVTIRSADRVNIRIWGQFSARMRP